MRAPSASKHPAIAANIDGVNGVVNGTGPRSSTRRRDAKSGKLGQDGDRRVQKKVVEPYGELRPCSPKLGRGDLRVLSMG